MVHVRGNKVRDETSRVQSRHTGGIPPSAVRGVRPNEALSIPPLAARCMIPAYPPGPREIRAVLVGTALALRLMRWGRTSRKGPAPTEREGESKMSHANNATGGRPFSRSQNVTFLGAATHMC